MSWFEAVPAFLIGVALVLLPGVPIALALGARGIAFVALSIGSSVSAVAVAAAIAPLLGLRWEAYTPFVVSLPLAVVGLLLRWWWTRFFPAQKSLGEWRWPFAFGLMGALIGFVLIAIAVKAGIGMPDWPSQTTDGVFHLNSVQQILDTHNASPLSLSLGSPDAPPKFYPAVWHGFVALIVQLSGAEIVVAANAMSFVMAGVIWPLSCIFLARQIFGQSKLALLLTGVLSAGFSGFPLLLLGYGVLYPYVLALALIPLALGLLVMAMGKGREPELETPGRWLLFLWMIGGIGASHPSAVFALMLLSAPIVVQGLVEYLARLRRLGQLRGRGTSSILVLVLAGALCTYGWITNGTTNNPGKPYETLAQAIGEALTNGGQSRPVAMVISVLMVIGVVVAVRTRTYWLVLSWLMTVGLFLVAASQPTGEIRTAIVGLWFNNSPRLSGMLPLLALPLATLGAVTVVRWLQAQITDTQLVGPEIPQRRGGWIHVGVAVLAIVVLIPTTQGKAIANAEKEVAKTFRLSDDSALLSPNEVAMFDYVAHNTPADAVIAGNPWDGSSLVYAYTDREALYPHVTGSWGDTRNEIAREFTDASPAVCAAIKQFKVTYILDFGDKLLNPNNPRTKQYPGLDNLEKSAAVELVATRGAAKLYKVTACGLG